MGFGRWARILWWSWNHFGTRTYKDWTFHKHWVLKRYSPWPVEVGYIWVFTDEVTKSRQIVVAP
jgi:hypothetical protein